jgi:hypothetical protein
VPHGLRSVKESLKQWLTPAGRSGAAARAAGSRMTGWLTLPPGKDGRFISPHA